MAEDAKSGGWWQTLPGILTAFAGVITAVAGLLLALHQAGLISSGSVVDAGTKTEPSAEAGSPQVKTVYIQYAGKSQQKQAATLREQLSAAGFEGTGITFVQKDLPESPEVRYFYPDDREAALQILEIAQKGTMPGAKLAPYLDYHDDPRGTLEVWYAAEN